jgi:glycogen debranching enzyme
MTATEAPAPTGVSKAGSLFAVFDTNGDIDSSERPEAGIYLDDTRFINRLRVRLAGRRLKLIRTEPGTDRHTWCLTFPETGDRPAIDVRRHRVLAATIIESVTVCNRGPRTFTGTLQLEVQGDFKSMFAIRGLAGRRPGELSESWEDDSGTLTYKGADGRERTANIRFSPPPDALARGRASYHLRMPPGEEVTVQVSITLRDQGQPPTALEAPNWLISKPRVETDVPLFDRVLQVSLEDLRMLLAWHGQEAFFAAGVPWFVALFGRDSILAALECLAFAPEVARDTLVLQARYQGKRFDERRDEEPGKILHELRRDELSNLGITPHAPYYGTVDATPLFLILLGQYVRWTGDLDLWRRLRPAAQAALRWIREYGDHDGDGFLDYEGRLPGGLANQGWKDSGNSIVNLDRSLAEPPIALIEVQAYAYRARLELAALYRATGEERMAAELEREARDLRRRILAAYWMPDRQYLAVALQRGGRRVETITSNAGHALWAGCLPKDHARHVANRLMDPSMFSGWGIRTMAEGEPGYDPADYQVGAVWPHDTAIIAAGLKRYGRHRDFERVFTAVFEAALHVPHQRLPELMGGHRREEPGLPVPYPAAASPQAWAAAAIPYLLVTAVGLQPDALAHRLEVVDPSLPSWLGCVRMCELRAAGSELDLEWRRRGRTTDVTVLGSRPPIEVIVGKQR